MYHVIFLYEGKERFVDVPMSDGCEAHVNTTRDVYYNRDEDKFFDTPVANQELRMMGNIFMTLGALLSAGSILGIVSVYKFEWVCHSYNAGYFATEMLDRPRTKTKTIVTTNNVY